MPDQTSAYQLSWTPVPSTRPSLCSSSPATPYALPQGQKGQEDLLTEPQPQPNTVSPPSTLLSLSGLCICASDFWAALSSI